MTREEKNKFIKDLDVLLNEHKHFYLADISGLTAEESSDLRRLCFKRDVTLKVVKNTLLKKAMENVGIETARGGFSNTVEGADKIIEDIPFPVIIRPSLKMFMPVVATKQVRTTATLHACQHF